MKTNRASRLHLLHLLPLLHQVGVGHHLHLVRHVLDCLLVVTLKHSVDWSLHNNCRYVNYIMFILLQTSSIPERLKCFQMIACSRFKVILGMQIQN